MIERVRLVNFTSHANTEVRLGEGLTVFVGRNGAGKSSVVDAITYALYNKHSRGENKNIVRDGAAGGLVELDLRHRGRSYTIWREFDTGGRLRRAELRSEGRLVATGEQRSEGVAKMVEEMLGMDYERLVNAVIIRQGELEEILSEDPRDLKSLFEDLMGLRRMETAYEKMHELLEEFDDQVRRELGYGVRELETLKKDLEQLTNEKDRLSEETDELRREQERLQEELRRVDEEMGSLRDREEAMRRGRERLKVLLGILQERARGDRGALREAEKRIAVLRIKDEIEERIRVVTELEGKISGVEEELHMLEARERALRERLSALEERRLPKEVQGEARPLQEWEDEARMRARRLKEHAVELGRSLGRGRGTQASLLESIVESEIEGVADVVRGAYASALATYLASLEEERERIESELGEVGRRIKEARLELSRYRQMKMEAETLNGEDIATLRQRIQIAQEEAAKYGAPDEVAERAERITQALEVLEAIRDDLERGHPPNIETLEDLKSNGWWMMIEEGTRREVRELLEAASSSADYQNRIESLRESRDRLSGDLAACRTKIEERERSLAQLSERISKLRSIIEMLARARKIHEGLTAIREKIFHRDGPVMKSLRTWIYARVSERGGLYLRLFNVMVDDVRIEESGRGVSFRCYYGGREVDAERLSGGEKVALALAIRLAMGDVLGAERLGFFILDEPTIFLDDENRKRLGEIFTSLSKAIRQVVVITHDEEVFENAETRIMRFEKTGAASPTRVEELSA